MPTRPEALRLADLLESCPLAVGDAQQAVAAAELRRLHAERAAADGVINDLVAKVRELQDQRDALLAEHQQTLALQQRSYEREIELEVEAERERIGDQCAEQIKTAIEDEREACAEVADGFDACDPKHIAAAIRARTP